MTKIITISKSKELIRDYGSIRLIAPKKYRNVKNFEAIKILINPSAKTSKHSHPMEEIFIPLSGECVLEAGLNEYYLSKENVGIVFPNEIHRLRNNKNFNCELLAIIAPPHDFRKYKIIE
jgi:quercetin dioxygenase-like cupin family protein